jgi:hypothetical protein
VGKVGMEGLAGPMDLSRGGESGIPFRSLSLNYSGARRFPRRSVPDRRPVRPKVSRPTKRSRRVQRPVPVEVGNVRARRLHCFATPRNCGATGPKRAVVHLTATCPVPVSRPVPVSSPGLGVPSQSRCPVPVLVSRPRPSAGRSCSRSRARRPVRRTKVALFPSYRRLCNSTRPSFYALINKVENFRVASRTVIRAGCPPAG